MRHLRTNVRNILALGMVVMFGALAMPRPASAEVPAGVDPNNAIQITLTPNETEMETGKLAVGEDMWYSMKVTDLSALNNTNRNDEDRPPLDLTLFVAPADGNDIHDIRMEIYQADYAKQWSQGRIYRQGSAAVEDGDVMPPFGAGRVVTADDERATPTDGNPHVRSLLWNGNVNNNQTVLVRLYNTNDAPVSYWLFTDDVIDAGLGQTS
jgi:hypothetical protein